MNTTFMNPGNSRSSDSQRRTITQSYLQIKQTYKQKKYKTLSNLSIYYKWKILKSCKNNKFKISAPTWNEEFELPDGSYYVSDIQDNFEYILKKHGEKRSTF